MSSLASVQSTHLLWANTMFIKSINNYNFTQKRAPGVLFLLHSIPGVQLQPELACGCQSAAVADGWVHSSLLGHVGQLLQVSFTQQTCPSLQAGIQVWVPQVRLPSPHRQTGTSPAVLLSMISLSIYGPSHLGSSTCWGSSIVYVQVFDVRHNYSCSYQLRQARARLTPSQDTKQ